MNNTLIVGLGGIGGDAVRNVNKLHMKSSLDKDSVKYLVYDTSMNDIIRGRDENDSIVYVNIGRDCSIGDVVKIHQETQEWFPMKSILSASYAMNESYQTRAVSRLMFFDYLRRNDNIEGRAVLNQLIDNSNTKEINVVVVTSLAGGTGSGMFIQFALWARKYLILHGFTANIKGFFVLPDAFANRIVGVKNDMSQIEAMYANTYSAIKELSVIEAVKKTGLQLEKEFALDRLFDSQKNRGDGIPVYDLYYLVGDTVDNTQGYISYTDEYSKKIGEMVYTHMLSSSHINIASYEDVLEKSTKVLLEKICGSIGLSKAVYPTEDMFEYCMLKAAKDYLNINALEFDREVKQFIKKENEQIKKGSVCRVSSPQRKFIHLFEKKYPDKAMVYSEKLHSFFDAINTAIYETVDILGNKQLNAVRLEKGWDTVDYDINEIKWIVRNKTREVEEYIEFAENTVFDNALEIADIICNLKMNEVWDEASNKDILCFLYSIWKENTPTNFVDVRYVIYRIIDFLEERKYRYNVQIARTNAVKGYRDSYNYFESPNARVCERTPMEYLENKPIFQSQKSFIKDFKDRYAQYNNDQISLCREFAVKLLTVKSADILTKRLSEFAKMLEKLFDDMPKIIDSIDKRIEANIYKNNVKPYNLLYVGASEHDKESLYRSLGLDLHIGSFDVYKKIIKSTYGRYCYEAHPMAEGNALYDENLLSKIYKEIGRYYTSVLRNDYSDYIDVDIYMAIYNHIRNTGVSDGQIANDAVKLTNETVGKLYDTSCSNVELTLSFDEEKKELRIPPQYYDLRIHDSLINMGIINNQTMNVSSNENKNEIAVYSWMFFDLRDVSGFDENNNGKYFRCYKKIVDCFGEKGKREKALTEFYTHLDKAWHESLPSISNNPKK